MYWRKLSKVRAWGGNAWAKEGSGRGAERAGRRREDKCVICVG